MLLSGSYIGWCGASDPVSTVPFGAYEPDTVHSHMVSEAKHVAYWQRMKPWVGDQVLSAVLKTIVHDLLSSQI